MSANDNEPIHRASFTTAIFRVQNEESWHIWSDLNQMDAVWDYTKDQAQTKQ